MSPDPQALQRLLHSLYGPNAKVAGLQRLSGGANQATYRLDIAGIDAPQRLALRLAGAEAQSSNLSGLNLDTEARLMQLARSGQVPSPEVVHRLRPEDGLGSGFLMHWLEGETLGQRIVREPRFGQLREGLAYRCGEVLAAIHALDPSSVGLEADLPRLSPEAYVRQIWSSYQALNCPQPMIDYTARWLLEHLPPEHRMGLVHNDFRNGNLMVDEQDLLAVLDWELAHIGDPIRDLGWICTNSWRFGAVDLPVGGFGHREDLLAGYAAGGGGRVDPEHLHFWEVFGSFWWAVGCLSMAQSKTGQALDIERAAIGRRSSECQADCVQMLIPGPYEPLTAAVSDPQQPSQEQLFASLRAFIQSSAEQNGGRQRFLSKVAGTVTDILRREAALNPARAEREGQLLRQLLPTAAAEDSLISLRQQLCTGLAQHSIPLNSPGLGAALRQMVMDQLAIDQPQYSVRPA